MTSDAKQIRLAVLGLAHAKQRLARAEGIDVEEDIDVLTEMIERLLETAQRAEEGGKSPSEEERGMKSQQAGGEFAQYLGNNIAALASGY